MTQPVGYLVTTALVAVCTAAALAPVRGPRSVGLMSWRLALVPNELPFHVFYLLLASTLLALGQGDLDSTGGLVGLGVAALASVGLAVVAWRGLRAGRAVDRALADGLGAGWQRSRRLPWLRILVAPWYFGRRDVERVADISYGNAGRRNLLDVYRPRSRSAGGPTLLYLHGGGFRSGRKNREGRALVYRLASQGWVCVSANYRLSPAAAFPDHLVDVKKVIAWLRQHGRDHGADPTVLFVAGSSAGAHLAAMAALTPNDPAFQPGFEPADTSVTGAIGLYGYYGPLDGDLGMPSSPLEYVGADAPPFFVAHGDADTFVPVAGARRFVERLRGASTSAVVYAELPGGQHSFDLFHSLRFDTVVDGIEAFTAWVRSDTPR